MTKRWHPPVADWLVRYVNDEPTPRPDYIGEPMILLVPQKAPTHSISKSQSKRLGRHLRVELIFIAAEFCKDGVRELRWDYYDCRVVEAI